MGTGDEVLVQWSVEFFWLTDWLEDGVGGRCQVRLESREVHCQGQWDIPTLSGSSSHPGSCRARKLLESVCPVLKVFVHVYALVLTQKGKEGELVHFNFRARCVGLIDGLDVFALLEASDEIQKLLLVEFSSVQGIGF